jgi:hypothetical protein
LPAGGYGPRYDRQFLNRAGGNGPIHLETAALMGHINGVT